MVSIVLLSFAFCNAQKADVTSLAKDIDFYHKTLEEKHIDLYHTISKENFTSEIQRIKDKLPQLTGFQVVIELMRLTHKVGRGQGDGHTSVPLWEMDLHKYPIELFDISGELRIVKARETNAQLLGKKLQSINAAPIKEVYGKVSELTPFTENKYSSMHRTCSYLLISEVLYGLNIVKQREKATFTFVDDSGNEESIDLEAFPTTKIDSFQYEIISPKHPAMIQPDSVQSKGLWFTSLNNGKTIHIKFYRYPSEEEMNTFSEGIYNYIEKCKSEKLIIDLRDNYGGDFFIGLILSSWLNVADSINRKSGVYILTDRVTYSAAMVNAVQYRQLLNAKIVGEPTGANLNGYQDLGQFKLPNSKLPITYTKRLFCLQETNTKGVQPDILIHPNWESYKNGGDEVLDWVLKDL